MSGHASPVDPAHLPYLRQRLAEVGLWFVDVPRTSSTTIKAALAARYGKLFGKRGVRQGVARGLVADHTPVAALRALVGAETWSRVRTLSVVRDPWARALSLYLYRRQVRGEDVPGFGEYVERLAASVDAEAGDENGKRWRGDLDPLFRYHGYRWSACRFICDAAGDFLVDAIVRFEDRDRELNLVARAWGVPALVPGAQKIGATKHDDYDAYYTAATRDLLGRAWRDDVERLEYTFQGRASAAVPGD